MSEPAELFRSREYASFRSNIALRRLRLSSGGAAGEGAELEWTYYDAGPRSVTCPLLFLPPICGTADVFFRQVVALSALGFRVLSVEYPAELWSVEGWCYAFGQLLNALNLSRVHLLGACLGGFLALKFAEFTRDSGRVLSVVLCNSFADTAHFRRHTLANSFWLYPGFALRTILLRKHMHMPPGGGPTTGADCDVSIIRSVNFVLTRMKELTQPQLASRLTLNCASEGYVQPHLLAHLPLTIIDTLDCPAALTDQVRDHLYKCFPHARLAHLKTGGNFPYLSRVADVNMHVKLHMKQFEGTESSGRRHTCESSLACPPPPAGEVTSSHVNPFLEESRPPSQVPLGDSSPAQDSPVVVSSADIPAMADDVTTVEMHNESLSFP